MATLKSITETAEAITAEATALVWEEYEAPRKRIPRARIVEHLFSVTIPKVTEDAAPLAFMVEFFPTMSADYKEYRMGYDQPVRSYEGKLYTPARFVEHPRYSGQYATPREELRRALEEVGIPEYVAENYAPAISRDEVITNQWYQYSGETADQVERETASHVKDLVIIGAELYAACGEPVYEYNARSRWNGIIYHEYITAKTDSWRQINTYGANDHPAISCYHHAAARHAYIRVLRPDLVTIDSQRENFKYMAETSQRHADEIREKIERLTAEYNEQQAKADESREKLESYEADPRAYWQAVVEYAESHEADTPRADRMQRRAAAIRRALH